MLVMTHECVISELRAIAEQSAEAAERAAVPRHSCFPIRLPEALAELSGWATGARLAYETLDDGWR
jgi:hypothetical protein